MKKIYFITGIIVIIIFAYFIFSSLPDATNKILTVTSNMENSNHVTGSFAFKSTPENSTLLKDMLRINSDFISNPPLKDLNSTTPSIKNFYKLEKFFPNFNSYYIAQEKISTALLKELPNLYNNVIGLSESELRLYLSNNTEYLSKNLGINDFSELSSLVSTLKDSELKTPFSCELEESYFYLPDTNKLSTRFILKLKDSKKIYIGAQISIYESNEYQSAPMIKFFGTSGGTSYV